MKRHEASPLLDNASTSNYDTARIHDEEEVDISSVKHNTLSEDNDEILRKRLNGASIYAIFSGLYIAVILSSLDSSIVATIYPQIGTEFKRSNEIVWIATSYMLSYTALQPLYGRISDVFGRKSALLFATCVFFFGSLFCGMATNLWALVVARAIAGVGGGGINCMTTVINSDLVPLRERGRFQSYGNIAYAVGSVVGAPLGGLLTDTLGWRFCFYINLPFLLLTIYIATQLLTNYNLQEDKETTFKERLKRIDYVGAIIIVLAVVSFLIATSLGGNIKAWSDPFVLSCFVCSFVLVILFCIIEAKYALYPLMPWNIISSRTPLACSFTNFWCVMATTALVYITPLFFQALMGFSPSLAGLYVLPKVASISIGSVLAGMYMSRTGEYRKITIVMALISFISMVGYTAWVPNKTSKAFMFACLTGDGLSFGAIITTTLIAMHSCVEHSEMATITSMSYLFRSVGGVIGISLTSAIFQGAVKYILTDKIKGPNADLYIEIARKSMTEVRDLLPPDVLQIVLDAYQVSLRYTYGTCILLSILTVLCTLFIQSVQLSNKTSR
ncbi:major facilitator superfamily domain-containing protein [Cokeromyces recurvatus]|uniref:major facilitator superfamily domain-containing protein n=1 Tax=Cokeromyces recurvatus TaxID=90255 RepID=UPI00221F9545|nr:major facilitator superfamily domain-containing protein [Cokeromyces recurvatus]KAI7902317.1 major facilitator superfamily domain-containing protein [Cokeromyces recurvatus]